MFHFRIITPNFLILHEVDWKFSNKIKNWKFSLENRRIRKKP